MLTEQQEAQIRDAVARGAKPNRQATGRVTLPLGGSRYAILATSSGLSAMGEYYREITGTNHGTHGWGGMKSSEKALETTSSFNQKGEKLRLLRRFVNGDWVYTSAGLAYFQRHAHYEYVVKVPIGIESVTGRQAGMTRYDLMPYTKMSGSNVFQSQVGSEADRNHRTAAGAARPGSYRRRRRGL